MTLQNVIHNLEVHQNFKLPEGKIQQSLLNWLFRQDLKIYALNLKVPQIPSKLGFYNIYLLGIH